MRKGALQGCGFFIGEKNGVATKKTGTQKQGRQNHEIFDEQIEHNMDFGLGSGKQKIWNSKGKFIARRISSGRSWPSKSGFRSG